MKTTIPIPIQEGSLRVNLIRDDGSFDTHPLSATLPVGADMTDVALHEILDLIKADTSAIAEVDVEDCWDNKWQKVRMILTFDKYIAPPTVIDLAANTH